MRVLLVLSLVLLPAAGAPHVHEECPCPTARELNEWCPACGAGYIGPLEVHSRMLHEILDPHGHVLDTDTFQCETCREAIATDGFCSEHGIGFLDKKAYFSLLSYELTRAERVDPSTVSCATCRKNMLDLGWCDECRLGRVGNVIIRDKETFLEIAHAVELLRLAEKAATECPECGAALLTGTECPIHRKRFEDGKVVRPAEAPERAPDRP